MRDNLLAGLAGFEPAYAGVKVLCLTAWRQPYIQGTERFVALPLSNLACYGGWSWIRTNDTQFLV